MIWLVWLKEFDNKYLGGSSGWGSHKSDILEFDPDAGRWRLVDRMIRERYKHAVSVVEYSEVAQSCNWGRSEPIPIHIIISFYFFIFIFYQVCIIPHVSA